MKLDKLITVLKYIGIGLVVILLGWTAYAFKLNIGGLVSSISGDKKKRVTAIKNTSGETVGTRMSIVGDLNPMRDKGKVTLEDGTDIQLPKGVKDMDVTRVTKIDIDKYEVTSKHDKLTDVFDG